MPSMKLNKQDNQLISDLVSYYESKKNIFDLFLNQFVLTITNNEELKKLIHSVKWRTKSAASLKDKLEKKIIDLKKNRKPINFSRDNLFLKINDLAGLRILHLHTTQFHNIDEILRKIVVEENYKIIEGPKARVWDDESRDYFNSINIKTVRSGSSLYTSVHYIINPQKQTRFTMEIQVRSLAEEIWGEVDHKINYKNAKKILTCDEQIKVLARVTSSCTRLVDSIFKSFEQANK